MTAEVAIINRGAVALAADSAVTLQTRAGAKVYNTVNKLFSLSRDAPVGVMIWGSADLCGVPWEVLIKEYRRELGSHRFDNLEDYCSDLREFLKGASFFTPGLQESEALQIAVQMYRYLLVDSVLTRMHVHFEQHGSVTRSQVVRMITEVLDEHKDEFERKPFVDGFESGDLQKIVSRYRSAIDAAIELAFEELPLGTANERKLRRIFALFCSKEIRSPLRSGLVVAGYGESDTFPKVVSHEVDGYLLDRPKLFASEVQTVTPESPAVVMPFAQREMVALFMEGVDPTYRNTIQGALDEFAKGLPELIADAIGMTGKSRQKLTQDLESATTEVLKEFGSRMESYSANFHVLPVIEAVAALPKDELGAMAESLVNLTSFKRRVTLDAETVGGEIDVAVISKGDGFIWLKRKHYFDPDRNPQFMKRYRQ